MYGSERNIGWSMAPEYMAGSRVNQFYSAKSDGKLHAADAFIISENPMHDSGIPYSGIALPEKE